MEGKEQAFKVDKSVWWDQGDVTRAVFQLEHCQDFSTLVKLNVASLERKGLPLQSKGEEEGMGRGKVGLQRSCLHLLPPSPQTAAANPSILVAAASSDSSCSLQTSALGSCLLCLKEAAICRTRGSVQSPIMQD